jgi:hypothetical protein
MYKTSRNHTQYEGASLYTHDHLTDCYTVIVGLRSSLCGQDMWVPRGVNGFDAYCRMPER